MHLSSGQRQRPFSEETQVAPGRDPQSAARLDGDRAHEPSAAESNGEPRGPAIGASIHGTWRADTLYLWSSAGDDAAVPGRAAVALSVRLPEGESLVHALPLRGREMIELLESIPASRDGSL